MKRNLFLGLSAIACIAMSANAADYRVRGYSSSNVSEESGVFIGFELGAGETKTDINEAINRHIHDAKRLAPQFGGKVGYKHLFNDYVGIRGYFGVNYNMASRDETLLNSGSTRDMNVPNYSDTSLLTYTANLDVLFNFYNGGGGNYGMFVGVGVGGVSTTTDAGVADSVAPQYWGADSTIDTTIKATGFYADAKIGLRAGMKNHGVDLIATIPFTTTKATKGISLVGQTTSITAKVKQNFGISLAYNYTF